MRSQKIGNTIMIKLERGEELIATLTDFCTREEIHHAVFTGIGAVERVEIGYYELATKTYHFQHFDETFEVASMQGNVAIVYPEDTRGVDGPSASLRAGKPFVHAHAVLSRCDESLSCIGAHIKSASVAVTLEISLTVLEGAIERKLDEDIGLKLLSL